MDLEEVRKRELTFGNLFLKKSIKKKTYKARIIKYLLKDIVCKKDLCLKRYNSLLDFFFPKAKLLLMKSPVKQLIFYSKQNSDYNIYAL